MLPYVILLLTWIYFCPSYYINCEVLNGITYQFPRLNGPAVEAGEINE